MRKKMTVEELILRDLYRPYDLSLIWPGVDFRFSCRKMFSLIGSKFDPRWIFDKKNLGGTWPPKQKKRFSRWHVRYLMREKGLTEAVAKFINGCFLTDFGLRVSDNVSDGPISKRRPRERANAISDDRSRNEVTV